MILISPFKFLSSIAFSFSTTEGFVSSKPFNFITAAFPDWNSLYKPESSFIGIKNLPTNILKATRVPKVKAPSGSKVGFSLLKIKNPAIKITIDVYVVIT